jgi:hypothetical protein
MAKLETTSAGDTTARRKVKEDSSSENCGTGGSCDDSSNVNASSAGRDKEIGGGGKEGVLTYRWIAHNASFGFLDLTPSILLLRQFWDGLEIESEHPKLILQAIRFGPKLSPWCWVSGSWVILAGIRVKTRQ